MTVQLFNSINCVRNQFAELCPAHAYQSYDVLEAIEKSYFRSWNYSAIKRPWRFFFGKEKCIVYLVSDDCGQPICVAACFYSRGKRECSCYGASCLADYTDFIYGDRPNEILLEAVKRIIERMHDDGVETLTFRHMAEDSITLKFLRETLVVGHSESVKIYIGREPYEKYFGGLSRHARQNVRTAYNRLQRDGHMIRFEFFSRNGLGKPIGSCGEKVLHQCESLYFARQVSRYKKRGWGVDRLLQSLLNYTTLSSRSPNMILAVLFVDEDIAAFMQGYLNLNQAAIEIPRLAICDEFGWYSPGLVMINECVKWLLDKSTVEVVDLCRGTEKYKFDMGGQVYGTKFIKVDLAGKNFSNMEVQND